MGNRPQTLYGIADSPVGLAAWILDHDIQSLELMERVFDGKPEGLTRDDILDNITLYWFTNTGISSARLYWENKSPFFAPKPIKVPIAVSVFPQEIYAAPEELGGEGLSHADSLQPAPQRLSLRGVGAAEVLHRGAPGGLPIAALSVEQLTPSPASVLLAAKPSCSTTCEISTSQRTDP